MDTENTFAELSRRPAPGLVGEFFSFLLHNKKWWLLPVLLVMALLAALIFASQSAVAPFVYTLF